MYRHQLDKGEKLKKKNKIYIKIFVFERANIFSSLREPVLFHHF